MIKKHVIILGASSGLGAECAKRFIETYNVSCLSRRGIIPETINRESAVGIACDGTSLTSIRESVEEAINRFGKFSLMIITSGTQNIKPVRAFKESETFDMLAVNIALPFHAATIFSSNKYSTPDSTLCLVSSIAAKRPEPGIVLYSATKAATEALVIGLAKELAPRRVVGVCPGWLDTPMTQKQSHVYNDKFIDALKIKSPLGIATTNDVVDAIEFLSSSNSSKITGQILVIDGGVSL
jgi:NAD(P)-dependent dehydrogenase (short-subunit alcohol dehydrogenase family)